MPYQRFQKNEFSDNDSFGKFNALKLTTTLVKGKKVLDIGCNEGFFCFKLKEMGASHCTGLDISQNWIDKAVKRLGNEGYNFLCGNIATIDPQVLGKYDIILILSAIHYMNGPVIIAKIASLLNPGGLFIYEGGVIDSKLNVSEWVKVPRLGDIVYHPTRCALETELIKYFSKYKCVGPSVNQCGDPIPRFVYHSYL